ncbi:RidA family protein [Paraglaciecola arctica]|uniref:RidA family protein n=1 Tax=Paraglaciecola arctica TaxID=1128911 RepID=UPI001C07A964|nr:Rid family detoxifying hydrolase [Paraglaciecola arctica]MBU3002380.1 Rid family detoxifying hydrolase [Paraglaciecola arctica]
MKHLNSQLFFYLIIIMISLLVPQQSLAEQIEYFSSQRNIEKNYPFSNAVRVGNLLFLSGEIGTLPNSSKLIAGGIKSETKQTMDNIQGSLAKHNLTMNDLVKCTVMLADIKDWPAFNHVYKDYFQKHFPARSAFATKGLALNARVEVECIAAFSKN